MYKTLRKESLRVVLPRIIVCLVLGIALLAVSGGGLLKLLLGPVSLTEPEAGQYVSFDASEVIVAFANLTVTNSDGDSETKKTYYLLPVGDEGYMAVVDVKERNGSLLERAMDQSYEYYLGDLESLTKLGAVSGTVEPLEDDMVDYMTSCIDSYALPGYEEGADSAHLVVEYQVELDHVGFLWKPVAIGLGIAGAVFLLLALAQFLVVRCGVYQKRVRTLIGQEDNGAFDSTEKIERVRVGKYIWYAKGPGSRALETEKLVWGYVMPEPMVVSKYRWPVALYDREQNFTRINFMEQKHCQDFLNTIADRGAPFVLGYTSESAQKFQDRFDDFLTQAEQDAKARRTQQESET